MTWPRILQNDAGPTKPLRERIDALFIEQRSSWPAFCAGEAALVKLPTKTITSNGDAVVVQLNVSRRSSVLAKTDPEPVAARACFLCPENFPAEERGVAFEDLVLLPNPYPVLPLHATVPSREHRPQRIAGRLESLMRLAEAVGPDLAITYNGPRCALAPDHFHFQCVWANDLPLIAQLPPPERRASVSSHSNFGREMYVFTGINAVQFHADVERMIVLLARRATSDDEPMINLAAWFDGERFTVLLFPRTRHRPASYFADGPERLVVSPGVLEMCGLFVVTHASDFDRMDADIVRSIYTEVCAPV